MRRAASNPCHPACATRRSVISVSVGERAQAKSQQLQEQLLNEGEAMRRAASNMTMKAARESLRSSGAAPELLSLLDEHLYAKKSQATQLRRTSQDLDQGQAKKG